MTSNILLILLLLFLDRISGQTCTSDAVFPRVFGVTADIDPTQAGKDISDSSMYYISELDTLIVASKASYDPH